MSDYEYDDDDEDEEESCEFKGKKNHQSKNERIYGDFFEAYEEQQQPKPKPAPVFATDHYDRFKVGSTIEQYSAEVEVDIPVRKRRQKNQQVEQPSVGQFSLSSFLNTVSGLAAIDEEDENSQEQNLGLKDRVKQKLRLVKIGEDDEEDINSVDLSAIDYERYLKLTQSSAKPKYQSEEEKQLAREFREGYGKGFKMLEKMGFNVVKGLGKEETGRQRPIEAVYKTKFMCKDEEDSKSEMEEEAKEVPTVRQQLFGYRSKDAKINGFLVELKHEYEKLHAQIFHCEKEIDSFEKEMQVTMSLESQKDNEIEELQQEVDKLADIERDLSRCQDHPHLALKYQLDRLLVKEAYSTLVDKDVHELFGLAGRELDRLHNSLNKFYLAKQAESIRGYSQATAIETKLHKQFVRKDKKVLINLVESETDITMVSPQDQKHIQAYVSLVVEMTVSSKLEQYFYGKETIQDCDDTRVIELLETIKKCDKEAVNSLTARYVKPLCQRFLRQFQLAKQEFSLLPHLTLFPWLTVISPSELDILGFYRRVASMIWSINSPTLLNLLRPFLKFSSEGERHFIVDQYLAPLLLAQMERFDLSVDCRDLLTGFTAYSALLDQDSVDDILDQTVKPRLLLAYHSNKDKSDKRELAKWTGQWRKQLEKISQGYCSRAIKEFDWV